jgi:hypothetical protein
VLVIAWLLREEEREGIIRNCGDISFFSNSQFLSLGLGRVWDGFDVLVVSGWDEGVRETMPPPFCVRVSWKDPWVLGSVLLVVVSGFE